MRTTSRWTAKSIAWTWRMTPFMRSPIAADPIAGPWRGPVVPPDGKHIAYLGFDDKRLGYQATQLYVMDSDGSHSHSLTPNLDRDAASPRWTGDSRQLIFQ